MTSLRATTGHSRQYPTPPGGAATLFGPFSTGDYIGWNGDVTLNYNAETPLYGAPSSNHLELSLPYFAVVSSGLSIAKRRAGRQPWPGGANTVGRPGLPGQQVDEYTNPGVGGVSGHCKPRKIDNISHIPDMTSITFLLFVILVTCLGLTILR